MKLSGRTAEPGSAYTSVWALDRDGENEDGIPVVEIARLDNGLWRPDSLDDSVAPTGATSWAVVLDTYGEVWTSEDEAEGAAAEAGSSEAGDWPGATIEYRFSRKQLAEHDAQVRAQVQDRELHQRGHVTYSERELAEHDAQVREQYRAELVGAVTGTGAAIRFTHAQLEQHDAQVRASAEAAVREQLAEHDAQVRASASPTSQIADGFQALIRDVVKTWDGASVAERIGAPSGMRVALDRLSGAVHAVWGA